MSLLGCTTEGVIYVLECKKYRREGICQQYLGESFRSAHQRGEEYKRDIGEGALGYPIVQYFWGEHNGDCDENCIKAHQGVGETGYRVCVDREPECHTGGISKHKSEWTGSKIPGLRVFSPNRIMIRKDWDRVG